MKMKNNKCKNKDFVIVIGNEYFFIEFFHTTFIFSYTTSWNSKIDRTFLKQLKQLEEEVQKK
jgi:hypothetical protein